MPLLAATNIELSYGDRRILDAVSLTLEQGERVGMVGRNGCGKTSLLRVIAGQMKCDAGSVMLQSGATTGYLAQDPVFEAGRTMREEAAAAFAHIEDLEAELHEVFEQMAGAEGEPLARLLKKQEDLEHRIDAAGGLATDHKVDIVLHGLGFTDSQFGVPVTGLSGGQKARLALAKLLLGEPDVLLLDEPTNHLDISGRLWLEEFLKNEFRGAVLVISHDRYLLDNVVGRIIEVEAVRHQGGRLIEYPGNYAAFRKLRAERRESQARAWEKQQTEFKREEAFIRKYKAGQRAKQAKGRESRLDRAKASTTLERPLELESMRLALPKAERTGDIVASVRGLSKSYANDDGSTRVLFEDLDLSIERGQRWGVIGPNGAGKTTLVGCLLGEVDPDRGQIQLGTKLAIGHYHQSHDGLDPEKTVVRHLQAIVRNECPDQLLSEQAARNLAGAFLFSGGDQEKELGLLSGGERGRAVLAGLMASAKNVLVLDEPTNHLDIPSAERLEAMLRKPKRDEAERGLFEGTLVLISHDRALLDACCEQLIVIDGRGGVEVFLGTYTEWHERQLRRDALEQPKPKGSSKPTAKPVASRAAKAETQPVVSVPATPPKKSKWSWMKLEQIEEKIGFIEEELGEIDTKLGDPDVWREIDKANTLTDRRDELRTELTGLEAEWLRKAE